MAFFKKKSDEEDEDKDILDAELPVKKIRRRDPKKEERPWGKRERLIVLFVLLLTAGTSAVLGLGSITWKVPSLPKISRPTFLFPFFNSEKVVLDNSSNSSFSLSKVSEEIQVVFSAIPTKDKSNFGVYVIDLSNNEIFEINSTSQIDDENIKRLIFKYVLLKASDEKIIIIDDLYKRNQKSTFKDLVGDQTISSAELNSITNEVLGEKYVTNKIEEIGFQNDLIENNYSLSTYGSFIGKAMTYKLLDPNNSGLLLSTLMESDVFDSRILNPDLAYYKWLNEDNGWVVGGFVPSANDQILIYFSGVDSENVTSLGLFLDLYKLIR